MRTWRILVTLLSLAMALAVGCTDDESDPVPELVSESVDPTTVDPDATRIVGFVRDYETAAAVARAVVSTRPSTSLVATRDDGAFLLSDDLVAGQLYTVEASAEGYASAAVPVLPASSRETRVDVLLIDAQRALPIELDPPVVAMPPSVVRRELQMRSRDESALQWRITEQPDWLVVEPSEGELEALGTTELAFTLEPQAFAQARRGIASGEALYGAVELRDERDRIAVVQVLVVPAADADVALTLDVETTTGDASLAVLGRFVDLDIEARYQSVALEGADIDLAIDGPADGLVVRGEPGLRTDDDGELELRLDAQATGEYTVRVSLPGWPDVAARQHTLTVVADDACTIDNGGCGARQFVQCVVDEVSGAVSCQDIDECQADDDGTNGCGVAQFWTCVDQDAAPPQCTDIDECATDNGGCGDALFVSCVDNDGAAPTCVDVDECAVDASGNNGCGVAARWSCTDNASAPPTCVDIDECATNNGGCGDPTFVACVDNVGAAPTCPDIDECATNNGGCGDAQFVTCADNAGGPPTCTDLDECATSNGGCGDAQFVMCSDNVGGAPTCTDIDECAANNGGCGDPAFVTCTDNAGGPPTCSAIDACTPDASGNNGCGVAAFWDCSPNAGAAPTCTDIDECATNNGSCGDPAFVTCTNNPGAAPTCTDKDECALGLHACHPLYQRCVDQPGAPATCEFIDECAEASDGNGDCGNPFFVDCIDNDFAPPTCQDVLECQPNASGINYCGVAQHWDCTEAYAAAPTCADMDECAVDGGGNNGCGVAVHWTCTDRVGQAPLCVDVDECATNNGGCDPTISVCVDNDGAAPTCADLDECATNNGGCDTMWEDCVNNVFAAPTCVDANECAPDANGDNLCGEAAWLVCTDQVAAAPICEDIDACEVINGANSCGDPANQWTCVDNAFAAPDCTACAAGTINLDLDPADGCEYGCAPAGAEQCNQLDDDCDGRVDEGFDLMTSSAHCGACNSACGSLPNAASTTCSAGLCIVLVCDAGWRDVNGDGSDGCEVLATGPVVYVDAVLGSPAGPGDANNPFDTLGGALGVVVGQADATIVVRPGIYPQSGDVAISNNHDGLSIVGESRAGVVIGLAPGDAIHVTGDDVTLSNLTVTGGVAGVHFDATTFPITRGEVRNVSISGQRGVGGSDGGTAWGVRIDSAANVRVLRSSTTDVVGANAVSGGAQGGWGIGIDVTNGSGGRLEGNTISNMRGARGGNICGGAAGRGGYGVGVALTSSTGLTVRANTISSLDGGSGGSTSNCCCSSGGPGGHAFGVYSAGGSSHTVSDNRIDDLLGGNGDHSQGPTGAGGTSFGLFANGTNLVTFERNVVSNLVGGEMGPGGAPTSAGGAVGVRLFSVNSATVRNLSVHHTAPGGYSTIAPQACVHAENSTATVLEHISCHDIGTADTKPSYGVLVAGNGNQVTLRDTIISGTNTACLQNNDVQSALTAGYVDLHDCGTNLHVNTTLDGNVYTADPLFVLSPPGNLRLLPTSPMIDAGDPLAPYDQEPAPNGCRVNPGAYGNTTEATAAPGATHCN